MRTRRRDHAGWGTKVALCAWASLAPILVATAITDAEIKTLAPPSFEFHDQLGRQWQRELVSYDLNPAQAKSVAAQRLLDDAGKEVLYQIEPTTGSLLFQADVPAFGESRYSFGEGRPSATTDLSVTETPQFVELSNTHTGFRLARTLVGETTQTPLLAWRLSSGAWTGGTRFSEPQTIAGCDVTITERGPVRARAVAALVFDNGDTWTLTVEMQAHEPVVKVHEQFDCAKHRTFSYVFSENFVAAYALVRSTSRQPFQGSVYPYGNYILQKLAGEMPQLLFIQPWVMWGAEANRNSSFSLVSPDWQEEVFFATADTEKWVDPSIDDKDRAPVGGWLARSGDGAITLDYTLARGERSYLIGSVPGAVDRANHEADANVPTVAQRCQMKHSDYPLDRVKDFVLAWPGASHGTGGFLSEEHRRLLLKRAAYDETQLARLQKTTPTHHNLEHLLPAYLATEDAIIERKLIELVINDVQTTVDVLTKLEGSASVTVGMAPHHFRNFVTTCNLLSTIRHSRQITDAEHRRLDAQIAFLGYLFNSPAFGSVDRGYTGFPNMTACTLGVQAAIASVVPGHPLREKWMNDGAGGLRRLFLDKWVDEHGEWLGTHAESLSYTRLTFDLALGTLYQAYASGIDPDAIYHPAVRAMGEWYANVATPRDARIKNWRHDPPVGHVYRFDLSPSLFALLAVLFKERDPLFASQMKWMQQQQGIDLDNAVGGFIPSFAGYRRLFMANDIDPVPPHYESCEWKESSVILRSHYDDTLENMLYMIAGQGHSHYDQDSGSVTLWGKGEIIADDFGYYGYAPGEDHTMIDSPLAIPASLMHVQAFESSATLDYARGRKEAWTRRILHVKHQDPAGPNYFVLHDTLSSPAPATWRMWLSAPEVKTNPHGATAVGLFRVDSDIVFATVPPDARMHTQEKTREGYGIGGNGIYGIQKTTQTGLLLAVPRMTELLAVVYPRLKGETPAEITAIADGRGLRIVTPWATDYIFASDRIFAYHEGPLRFRGTLGFARIVGDAVTLDLKEGGTLSYGDRTRTSDKPMGREANANLYADGDLLSGEASILVPTGLDHVWQTSLLDKSPLPGQSISGFVQRAECRIQDETKWRHPISLTQHMLFVDARKTYRVRMRIYIPDANRVILGGYARSQEGGNMKAPQGNVWSWSLPAKGPTDGFAWAETTIGPERSGAENMFPADTLALDPLAFRVYDKGYGVFYIDALHIEEIDPEL